MPYNDRKEYARDIRKKVQKAKEEHFPNLVVRLNSRKSINSSARLVEIVKNRNGIEWGRIIVESPSNYLLDDEINTDEEYLVERIKSLFSAVPSVNVTKEIKEAGLSTIKYSNRLSRLFRWEKVFLGYEYDESNVKYTEEWKFPNRLYCGKERYTTWGGQEKEGECETRTPINTIINMLPSENASKKKTEKEKNAIKAIEWAAEFSEWANGPCVFIYGKDKGNTERVVAVKANNITVTFDGRVIIDRY